MYVLLPNYPLRGREVDPDFAEEFAAAAASGFDVRLYEHESLVRGDVRRALRFIDALSALGTTPAPMLFRGWMMPDTAYAALYGALADRGFWLVNDPAQYAEAHYLPLAYPKLEGHTPFTVWCSGSDPKDAWRLYQQQVRDGDAILKDYVKSAKHRWNEACFIPAGSDEATFRRIVEVFLADRGNLFEKGIVLRRYVPLVTRGEDMRGYPIARECRLFFVEARVLIPLAPAFAPPDDFMETCRALAGRFGSRFMSMDIAETRAGPWTVIEVGDGGVSGLPVSLMADDFYAALRHAFGP